jgi:hypothetical protein
MDPNIYASAGAAVLVRVRSKLHRPPIFMHRRGSVLPPFHAHVHDGNPLDLQHCPHDGTSRLILRTCRNTCSTTRIARGSGHPKAKEALAKAFTNTQQRLFDHYP